MPLPGPKAALLIARLISSFALLSVAAVILLPIGPMIHAAARHGWNSETIGAVLSGIGLLCAICAIPAIAAIGLWRGLRWAWWVELVLMALALVRYPAGTVAGAILILLLLLIQRGYFRSAGSREVAPA